MKAPLILFILLAMVSAALGVSGIYMLAGTGWALIAASVAFMAGAWFILRGLSANG